VEIELTGAAAIASAPKKEDKEVRRRIVAAAFSVLQEVGSNRLRVQEVAKRAGVSPTLLYYYFDGKHALIAAAYAQDYATILEGDLELVRTVFASSETATELHANAITRFSASFGDRDSRRRRLDALSAAQHDPVVSAAIAPKQREFNEEFRTTLLDFQEQGWLPESFDLDGFMLIMLALPFGMVYQDLDPTFDVNPLSVFMMMMPAAQADRA
jgi:AcrR family transcriptional regulator